VQFDAAELDWAEAIIRPHVPPTPQYARPLLAERFGAEVWVKHENHTPTGAFKVRGGLTYVARLRSERPDVVGLVTSTRGNHGQSIAFAGWRSGLGVTIVVPLGNSPDKNASMRAFGAVLIEHGADYQEAREHACAVAEDRGLDLVPPFHPSLVVGVATLARELFSAAGELDAVYVPIGMGSCISGVIGVRDLLGLRTEVIGVVAENAPAMARSFAAGRAVSTDTARTFVDGVACRVPDASAVTIVCAGATRVVEVSEEDAAEAVRVLFATTHNVGEPAGAIALAGLLKERSAMEGSRVAVVQTGGNADAGLLEDLLAGKTPAP
jgi:threonine dehydratase